MEYTKLTEEEVGELLVSDTPEARVTFRKTEELAMDVIEIKNLQSEARELRTDIRELKSGIHRLEAKADRLDDVGKRELDNQRRKLAEKEVEFQKKQTKLVERAPELRTKEKALTKSLRSNMSNFNMRTEKDGAVLFSSEAGRRDAKRFCKEPGNEHCKTIDMTPGGKWLNRITDARTEQQRDDGDRAQPILSKPNDKAVWRAASLQFVKGTSGWINEADQSRLYASKGYYGDSHFYQAEIGTAMQNWRDRKVTGFREIKLEADSTALHVTQEKVHERKKEILQGRDPGKPREEGREP